MIFSADKWNSAAEIKAFVKVNTAISFNMLETPLRNAFRQFLKPLLGDAMAVGVMEIYQEQNTEGTAERKKSDADLLEICQRANANLAFWYDFDEISTRITDAGFQRQESENGTFKPAYKYQEDNLRMSFRNKGFNALDELLEFLYLHIADYPEFAASQAYRDRNSAIVRNTFDVNEIYTINNSRIVFLRLQPHLKFVEEMLLQPAMGEELYERLLDGIVESSADGAEQKKIERLRQACARFIVTMAIRRLLMETGSITDRGLYFTTIENSDKGNERKQPVDVSRIAVQIQNMKTDADMYMSALQRIIRKDFTELDAGDPQRVFDRDNTDKRTFWT